MVLVCWLVLASASASELKSPYSFRGLGDLPEGDTWSQAYAVSGDGKVVVGTGYGKFGREGFVWTAKDGMRSIGKLKPIDSYSEALAVSSDGTVVVGFSKDIYGEVAAVWTAEGGLRALPRIRGDISSRAVGVSSGGVIILGTAKIPVLRVNWTAESIQVSAKSARRSGGLQQLSLTAGSSAGWVLRRGGEPVHYDVGVKPFEFFQAAQGWAAGLVTWIRYSLCGGSTQTMEAEGPPDTIGCVVLGDILPTAISESGAVICGVHSVRLKQGSSLGIVPSALPPRRPEARDPSDPSTEVQQYGFVEVGGTIKLLPKRKNTNGPGWVYPFPVAISASGMDLVGWEDTVGRCKPARWKAVTATVGSEPPGVRADRGRLDGPATSAITAYELCTSGSGIGDGGITNMELEVLGHLWAVSADGVVAVGDKLVSGFWPQAAFQCSEGGKMRVLYDLLKAHCPKEVEGWHLQCARGISKDGRTIVGYGINPQGKTEAWLATTDDLRKPYEELMRKKKNLAADEPDD